MPPSPNSILSVRQAHLEPREGLASGGFCHTLGHWESGLQGTGRKCYPGCSGGMTEAPASEETPMGWWVGEGGLTS